MFLLPVQERIIGLLHGQFIFTLSGRISTTAPSSITTALSLPEVPQRIALKTLVLHDRAHVQVNAYTQKQHFAKNLPLDDTALAELVQLLLEEPFTQAHIQTPEADTYARAIVKKRIPAPSISFRTTPPSKKQWEVSKHNSDKHYLVTPQNSRELLHALGITGDNGVVRAPMQAKYRQINHFLALATQLDTVQNSSYLHIVDCGCGKAYLSLSLYHVLANLMGKQVELTGIDTNAQVIEFCNRTAQKLDFGKAEFRCMPISDFRPEKPVDLVIALHACDTATDDALALAVQSDARAILAAPCCHHYVNSRLRVSSAPQDVAVLLQDGITRERLADLLTDSLRRDILQGCGYAASLMEFVSPEHTMKNIMIRAERTSRRADTDKLRHVREEIQRWHTGPKLAELLNIDKVEGFTAEVEQRLIE